MNANRRRDDIFFFPFAPIRVHWRLTRTVTAYDVRARRVESQAGTHAVDSSTTLDTSGYALDPRRRLGPAHPESRVRSSARQGSEETGVLPPSGTRDDAKAHEEAAPERLLDLEPRGRSRVADELPAETDDDPLVALLVHDERRRDTRQPLLLVDGPLLDDDTEAESDLDDEESPDRSEWLDADVEEPLDDEPEEVEPEEDAGPVWDEDELRLAEDDREPAFAGASKAADFKTRWWEDDDAAA